MPQKHQYTSPRGITQFLRYSLNLKNIQRGKLHKLINPNKIVFRAFLCFSGKIDLSERPQNYIFVKFGVFVLLW